MTVEEEMLRPPINRAMRVLDRAFFCKNIVVPAARVKNVKHMSKIRGDVLKSKDMLSLRQITSIQPDPAPGSSMKCILLEPRMGAEVKATWSDTITRLVSEGDIDIISFPITLNYKHWTAHDILSAVLPSNLLDDLPTAFSHAGHIAQLNLREAFLPYKHLIGEVLLDKNPAIRTVINKRDTLGAENEYRVLDFELVAGEDDMQVEARESGCAYRFDFSKVFWNSRLSTEHQRLIDTYFAPGEIVCDVMAGVGPFAIPAAKKGVFVWANDLNPDCYMSLLENISANKVSEFMKPFNQDAHSFIPESAQRLLVDHHVARIPLKISRTHRAAAARSANRYTTVHQPKIISHYVMNLPSTATDFLPDFIGLYRGHEREFEPYTQARLPMVHCYCFGPKNGEEDPLDEAAKDSVCKQISEKILCKITPQSPEVDIFDVRDVAPNKRQFCASFRLPSEVAFGWNISQQQI